MFELLLKEYGDQSRVPNFFYGSHPNNVDRFETLTALARRKYAKDVKEKRLSVNTEEFKRVTRAVVIATGRLDYEASRFPRRRRCSRRPCARGRTIRRRTTTSARSRSRRGSAAAWTRRSRALPIRSRRMRSSRRRIAIRVSRTIAKGDRAAAIASLERYLELDPERHPTRSRSKRRFRSSSVR